MADNLLDKASILLTPTAYNDGSMLSVKPENGDGDFTFSRSSAATRVNAQGLVENVQIISSELVSNGNFSQIGTEEVSNGNFSQEGSELVTNGDFATDSDWNKDTSWTIENGAANYDGLNSVNDLQQTNVLIGNSGTSYVIRFEVKSGTLRLLFAEGAIGLNSYANYGVGTHTIYVKKTTSSTELRIYAQNTDGGTSGSIDNVSVKEVGQDWTISSGASVGEDKLDIDAGAFDFFATQTALTNGLNYKVTLDAEVTSGDILLYTGTQFASINSSGSYTFYTTSDSAQIRFRSGGSGFNGSITNISVKEVGQDWTFGSGWSLDQANSKVIGDGTMTGGDVVRQIIDFTQGTTYKFSFTVLDYVSGTLFIRNPFNGYLDAVSANGSYSFDYVAGINDYIDFRGNSFVGSFTNVSVKEITDDTDLPRINYEGFSYQDSLGSEEIVNGDFATDSNWNKGTGWSIANGSANSDGTNNYDQLRQTNILTIGNSYKLTFDLTYISGLVKFTTPSVDSEYNSSGSYTLNFIADSANVVFTAWGAFTGSIDNVSVKEVIGQEVVPDSGCGSWLLEPQSTNSIINSNSVTTFNYGGGITASNNAAISPDNTFNAMSLIPTTISGTHRSGYNTTAGLYNQNDIVTFSCFVKSNGYNFVRVGGFFGGEAAVFNVSNGTLVLQDGNVIRTEIIKLTNDWYRLSVTYTFQNSINNGYLYAGIQVMNTETGYVFTGDGISGLYAYGTQAELGTGTSYIPTNGATNTRLQDIANNSGNSTLINSTEGVLYAEIAALADDLTNRMIALSDSNSSDHVRIYYTNSTNKISVAIKSNGSNQYIFLNYNVTDITSYIKIAVKYKANDFATFINGVKVNSQTTTSSAPIGLDRLNFDSGVGGSPFYGKAKALAVFKEALTDAQLQSLTTI